jgi:hypothetical protein
MNIYRLRTPNLQINFLGIPVKLQSGAEFHTGTEIENLENFRLMDFEKFINNEWVRLDKLKKI